MEVGELVTFLNTHRFDGNKLTTKYCHGGQDVIGLSDLLKHKP